MILLTPVADSPELMDTACPYCQTGFHVPCVLRVNARG